jgi:hypothetical protein
MPIARDLRVRFHLKWFIFADIEPLIDFVSLKKFSISLKFISSNLEVTPRIESAQGLTFTIKSQSKNLSRLSKPLFTS